MTKETVLKKIKEYEEVFGEKLPEETTNRRNFAENYVWAINECISKHKTMAEMGWSIMDFFDECPRHAL